MKKEKAGILWESPGCVVKSDIAPHAWGQEPRKDQQPNGYLVLIIWRTFHSLFAALTFSDAGGWYQTVRLYYGHPGLHAVNAAL